MAASNCDEVVDGEAPCAICGACCPPVDIATHFERCFADMMPVGELTPASREGSEKDGAEPALFGDLSPGMDANALIIDLVLPHLAPTTIGLLSQVCRGWLTMRETTGRHLEQWRRAQLMQLHAMAPHEDCTCADFVITAAPTRFLVGKAAKRLEGGLAISRATVLVSGLLSLERSRFYMQARAPGGVLRHVLVGDLASMVSAMIMRAQPSPGGGFVLVPGDVEHVNLATPLGASMVHLDAPLLRYVHPLEDLSVFKLEMLHFPQSTLRRSCRSRAQAHWRSLDASAGSCVLCVCVCVFCVCSVCLCVPTQNKPRQPYRLPLTSLRSPNRGT